MVLAIPLLLGAAAAQDTLTPLELKLRFGQVAARAVANFRAADSIAERLHADGFTLHPRLIALRLKIEAALDQTQAALDASDVQTANETVRKVEALVNRFARQIGGD